MPKGGLEPPFRARMLDKALTFMLGLGLWNAPMKPEANNPRRRCLSLGHTGSAFYQLGGGGFLFSGEA